MSVLDFSSVPDIIGEQKELQWIAVGSGNIQNRDYIPGAEADPVDFMGWFVPTPQKMQLKETGRFTPGRFTLRFNTLQNEELENMKIRDIIVYNNVRYVIDTIVPFEVETNMKHFSCVKSD